MNADPEGEEADPLLVKVTELAVLIAARLWSAHAVLNVRVLSDDTISSAYLPAGEVESQVSVGAAHEAVATTVTESIPKPALRVAVSELGALHAALLAVHTSPSATLAV